MNLVVQVVAPKPYRDAALKACVASHHRFLTTSFGAVITIPPCSPAEFNTRLVDLANLGDVRGDFILTRDSTFLTDSFDPHFKRCHLYSMWMKRSGDDTVAMTSTINILSSHGGAIQDFESPVPMVMNANMVKEILLPYRTRMVHSRTLYFNSVQGDSVRFADPTLEKWTKDTQPHPVITALDPKCYDNKNCRGWLTRVAKGKTP